MSPYLSKHAHTKKRNKCSTIQHKYARRALPIFHILDRNTLKPNALHNNNEIYTCYQRLAVFFPLSFVFYVLLAFICLPVLYCML